MSENTTKLVLTVAVVGMLVYFVVLRPKTAAVPMKTLPPKSAGPGQFSTQNLAADANAFAKLVGSIGGLFKSSSSPAVPVSTTMPVQNIPDTATSNYLADATAASDSESGVVGFGGWD